MIAMIWAQDQNGLIGNSKTNQLPWPKMSEDLNYLKEVTTGQIVVMGRKTFESLPNGPLKNRINVVLTSQNLKSDVLIINKIDEIKEIEKENPNHDIFILGGIHVYQGAIPFAQRFYRTTIDGNFEGDLYMPEINYKLYKKISTKDVLSSKGYKLTFEVFDKID
ncbi:dihydrofolate reductase [Xylocopilactobacillus apis]|uniref:dihydrofolate reductase n=1 Tax=Xylocopilactobacillus apis TaxID=2932183 RepID=A0AAU9CRH6_9LACO|nr:dihydrofolate reductase [Xylocopilactobacillus apis]BDR56534.1 dihydrofolate reductase [Xylocopilactobacillus apis]